MATKSTSMMQGLVLIMVMMVTSSQSAPFDVSATEASRLPTTELAEYSCVFTNQWSSARHPNLYPSDAHWSPPLLSTHDSTYVMWSPGELASLRVETVAETGDTTILINELSIDADAVFSTTVGDLTFNSVQQQQTLDAITFSPDHPLVSGISMIAPSPDWFTGFYSFNAGNPTTQTWYRAFTITTYPWDAGTEQGERYSLANDAETPHVPITQFTATAVPSTTTGVFLSTAVGTGGSGTILPVATWTCTINAEPACKTQGTNCVSGLECCGGQCASNGLCCVD